jgi:hypothetical protein
MLLERVPWEVVMNISFHAVDDDRRANAATRRREESDWMLNAIVGAIVAGALPPDDAFAWARIAAYEVAMFGTASSASELPRR